MTLDLAPRPGSASLPGMVRAQAVMEARLLARNGEQFLLAIVIPLIALVGGVIAGKHLGIHLGGRPVDVLTPGVMALGVMSSAFTSVAISTGFERRYGVLKRLGTSPLPRSGLLLGKVAALLIVEFIQLLVIAGVGLWLGWRPAADFPLVALPAIALGTTAFAALGLLIAGTLRAEATLAAANLVYLLLMAGGAVILPAHSYGGWGHVATWLPSGALGEALRQASDTGTAHGTALLVLAAWTLIGAALTARTFKWE